MSRLIVVCAPDLAVGFRLCGIETVTPEPSAVSEVVERLLADPGAGVVALAENLFVYLTPRVHRQALDSNLPAVLPLPVPRQGNRDSLEDSEVARMIRGLIGYHVRIHR